MFDDFEIGPLIGKLLIIGIGLLVALALMGGGVYLGLRMLSGGISLGGGVILPLPIF